MSIKKNYYCLYTLIAFMACHTISAQQKPVSSQYMFNGLLLNPAYAGVHDHLNANFSYRNQWVNLEGAPSTTIFSMHSGIKHKNIGLGLLVMNDRIGAHTENAVFASYSYKIHMMHGTLSMGLQAGFNNLASDYTNLNLQEATDPFFGVIGDTKINFGTGVFYNSDRFYAGVSIPYIRRKRTINDLDYLRSFSESRNYYVTGGLIIDLSPKVKIKPSTLLRFEDGMPVAGDMNLNLFLEEVLNLGVSYRSGDSFITLFEIKLNDYLRFGYAYDWIISDLSYYTDGTHEFMLNYRINLFAPKKHRMCPGPYYF